MTNLKTPINYDELLVPEVEAQIEQELDLLHGVLPLKPGQVVDLLPPPPTEVSHGPGERLLDGVMARLRAKWRAEWEKTDPWPILDEDHTR